MAAPVGRSRRTAWTPLIAYCALALRDGVARTGWPFLLSPAGTMQGQDVVWHLRL